MELHRNKAKTEELHETNVKKLRNCIKIERKTQKYTKLEENREIKKLERNFIKSEQKVFIFLFTYKRAYKNLFIYLFTHANNF